jgi:hypothetical protein
MKLIRVTVEVAFHDVQEWTQEGFADILARAAIDGAEAEVTRIDVEEKDVAVPDPDFDGDNDLLDFDTWQERAHEELDAWPKTRS